MNRIILFLTFLTIANSVSFAQNRGIARGAEPGELYLTGFWWGHYNPFPPFYDTLRLGIYRITENGKKLAIQYNANYFGNPEIEIIPRVILADATSGVVYNKLTYYKEDGYPYTQFWFSDDYGINWLLREENMGSHQYFPANVDGVIYRGVGGLVKSIDYGQNFVRVENLNYIGKEPGLEEKEVFNIVGSFNYGVLTHTLNYFETYTQIIIHNQFIYGNLSGLFPDVYRGGLPGEVYISSWFPGYKYRVSFSDDYGETFRHVYICDENCYNPNQQLITSFMSDREPGEFYIIKQREIATPPPSWGWYTEICIDYYRDYGETLEATFCHHLTKDYEYEEVVCDNVTNLEIEKVGDNSVMLQWASSIDEASVRGYRVYRKDLSPNPSPQERGEEASGEWLNGELINETFFIDSDLPNGEYEYYIRTFHKLGCVSDISNVVTVSIEYIEYEITFKIQDTENNPINEATILINEIELTTNELGVAVISLISGSYPFTVSKIGYIEVSESVLVEGAPRTVEVTLEKETFEVKFEVVDEKTEQPIAEAEIFVENFENSFFTDDMGIVKFFSETGSFSYIVTKEKFDDYIGVLIVENSAVTERVEMTEKLGIDELDPEFNSVTSYELRVYPNPASGSVTITGADLFSVEIYDIQGRMLAKYTNLHETLLIDDLNKDESGIYLVKMYSKTGANVTQRLIIK